MTNFAEFKNAAIRFSDDKEAAEGLAKDMERLRKKLSVMTLGNPKILKGTKKGYLSAVLHFAPSDLSGYNVCPMAIKVSDVLNGTVPAGRLSACSLVCLNLAGRGGMAKGGNLSVAQVADGSRGNTIQTARVRRTRLFFEKRDEFFAMLANDIRMIADFARDNGLIPCIRLNGTSDIRWESIGFTFYGTAQANIMGLFPNVQFYDYTKIANRRDLPSNYHLTFSLSENNDTQAVEALSNGMNVAVVFRAKDIAEFPSEFMGARVVNADDTDLRFLDGNGVICALKAKGPAKKDTSGFVREITG